MTELVEALGIDGGIVAAIGAGGKKSLLYALAATFPGRVAWTATVHTPRPPRRAGIEVHVGDEAELLALARRREAGPPRAFFLPSEKTGRVAGLSAEAVDALHAAGGFDLTLVKADGARMRGIKAPRPGEPVLPAGTGRVLAVVSAAVIGQPLDEAVAHRPERIARVVGARPGDPLSPEHIARLLTAPGGALEGTGQLPVVPVINQVDDPERLERATAAARAAIARTGRFDRVVLTCLKPPLDAEHAVVAVIEATAT